MRPRVARVVLRKGHKERAMCHLGNSQEEQVRTEVRAPSAHDARWLLWAQYGFHSILTGPMQVRVKQSP